MEVTCEQAHPKEEEDDTVTGMGHRLRDMVYSCVAFIADVGHGVPLHHDTIANDTDDSRPVEKLSADKSQVAKAEDEKRFSGSSMTVCVLGEEAHKGPTQETW